MWAQAKALLLGLLQTIHNGITSVGIGTNFAWGLAIIALTLLVRLLMHPLTAKQMASMQKMQKLKPQLDVLQEKYGDDKDKLNQETMALYKDNKVNPMSGCLPLIIQLPIFILLYGVLYDLTKTEAFTDVTFLGVNLGGSVLTTVANALNLVDESGVRIPDEQLGFIMVFLSSFTNLSLLFSNVGMWLANFILLVLIAYLTWLQQHLTSAGNSQMAMMNWFMPLFLTFICFGLPGGVLLYWGVSSLMGIVHQMRVSKKTSEEMSVKPTLYKEKPKTK